MAHCKKASLSWSLIQRAWFRCHVRILCIFFLVSGNLYLTFDLTESILFFCVLQRVIHCLIAGRSVARLLSFHSLWEFPSPSSTQNDTHMLWTADSLSESMTSPLLYKADHAQSALWYRHTVTLTAAGRQVTIGS